MPFRKTLTALGAAGILLGSTAAVAAPAPVADARTASPVAESEGAIGSLGWIIAVLIAAGVALVVIDDDNEDDPASA